MMSWLHKDKDAKKAQPAPKDKPKAVNA
jgi:hypothetical protein